MIRPIIESDEPGYPKAPRSIFLLFRRGLMERYRILGGIFDSNGKLVLGTDGKPVKSTTHIAKLFNFHKGYEQDGYKTRIDKNGNTKKIIKWKKVREPDELYLKYRKMADEYKVRFNKEYEEWISGKKKVVLSLEPKREKINTIPIYEKKVLKVDKPIIMKNNYHKDIKNICKLYKPYILEEIKNIPGSHVKRTSYILFHIVMCKVFGNTIRIFSRYSDVLYKIFTKYNKWIWNSRGTMISILWNYYKGKIINLEEPLILSTRRFKINTFFPDDHSKPDEIIDIFNKLANEEKKYKYIKIKITF